MSAFSKGTSIPVLGHVTLGGIVLGIVIGIVLAPQIRRLPGIDRLPTV